MHWFESAESMDSHETSFFPKREMPLKIQLSATFIEREPTNEISLIKTHSYQPDIMRKNSSFSEINVSNFLETNYIRILKDRTSVMLMGYVTRFFALLIFGTGVILFGDTGSLLPLLLIVLGFFMYMQSPP